MRLRPMAWACMTKPCESCDVRTFPGLMRGHGHIRAGGLIRGYGLAPVLTLEHLRIFCTIPKSAEKSAYIIMMTFM